MPWDSRTPSEKYIYKSIKYLEIQNYGNHCLFLFTSLMCARVHKFSTTWLSFQAMLTK